MNNIKLEINEKDGELFEYLSHCKDEVMVKNALSTAIELYNYCTGKYEVCKGYPSPTSHKRALAKESKEKLIELKKEYQKEILEWAATFDPDQVDCGVMRGPDDDIYWFVEECGPLGYITLYSHYIKMIDELLLEKGN